MLYLRTRKCYMQSIFNYFLIFFIYSILGWIVESIYVSIKSKQLINRGFLIGTYCPIYGYGCLCIILYLEQYKNNILTVFLLGTLICCILEYITSYIMELLFKTRWWDYSEKKFNLNGRICGENALLFGLGGIIIIYIVHPFLTKILSKLNPNILFIISIISFIIFITDTLLSLKIMSRLKNTIRHIELKDSTQEISKLVKETIHKKHKIFQERLYQAFPNIEIKKLLELKDDIKDEFKELLKK